MSTTATDNNVPARPPTGGGSRKLRPIDSTNFRQVRGDLIAICVVAEYLGVRLIVIKHHRATAPLPRPGETRCLVVIDDRGQPRMGPAGYGRELIVALVKASSDIFVQSSYPNLWSYNHIVGVAVAGGPVLVVETGRRLVRTWKEFVSGHAMAGTAIGSMDSPRVHW
jgi:hypothetical protein